MTSGRKSDHKFLRPKNGRKIAKKTCFLTHFFVKIVDKLGVFCVRKFKCDVTLILVIVRKHTKTTDKTEEK